jgi:D-xylose transport system substrate-binding protein
VYKPVVEEANGAVAAAAALLAGTDLTTIANATIDNENGEIPYVQAQVTPIYIADVKIPVADGFVSFDEVCAGIEDLCEANGVVAG